MSLADKRLFLLDMDGTIYNDNTLFDRVNEFLDFVEGRGGRYIFITNNSSRSVEDYVKKLSAMGVRVTKDSFFTSAQATALYIRENYPDTLFYCVGTKSLVSELEGMGVKVTTLPQNGAQGVLVGYDTELTYEKVREASRLLQNNEGIPYIATNPDRVCPTDFGSAPDCYAICQMLKFAVGRDPVYIGKPDAFMIKYAVGMTDYTARQTVVVGDRLYTDIASGVNAGVDTVCVLSGESSIEDIEKSEVKPAFVLKDIGELLDRIRK